ncbi:MAG TPA: type II CAAX endopeptidase family protein [Candidatus Angelobacter sp.]
MPAEDPVWNLLDVLAILGFAIFSLVMIGGLAVSVAHSLPAFRNIKSIDLTQNPLVLVPAQAFAYLLVIAFMVLIVRLRHGAAFLKSISWNSPPAEKILVAIAGAVGLALFSAIFTLFTSRWVPKSLPIERVFHDTTSVYLFALFGIIFAPLVEELFFRGFLYPVLTRGIGVVASVILTSASFAMMHQGQLAHAWVPLTWLFLVGIVFTLVRVKTRSVALCVIVHLAYNTTLFTMLFIGTQGFHHFEQG